MKIYLLYRKVIASLLNFNGIPALFLRLYLAPTFIMAGYTKTQFPDENVSGLANFLVNDNIVNWFGNTEWGLGLPMPELLATMAAWFELFGGILLIFGLMTRLVSLPLMFTMFIAITSVHSDNGWFAITPSNPDTSPAQIFNVLGFDAAQKSLENSQEVGIRLSQIRDVVAENANADWLFEKGNIVVLNNGIEFAATYFIMLLALFFIGAGRWVSIDFYVERYLKKQYKHPIKNN